MAGGFLNLIKKRLGALYAVFALFAVMNYVILAGIVGYAWWTGALDREKAEQIAAIMRDEELPETEETEDTGQAQAPSAATTSADKIRQAVAEEEIWRLKVERAEADLKQQQTLLDRNWIKLQDEMDRFEQRKLAYEEQIQNRRKQELSESFMNAVDAVAGMKPKNAIEALMQKPQADALKILSKLPERNRTNILDSCKTQEQKLWRDEMLSAMIKKPVLTGG